MFRSCLRSAAFAVPAAFLLALLATPSSAIQRTVTIYQIQDTTSVGHVVEGSTDTVTTQGICTGADTRPTGFGFYIQDPAGGNYSGVQVFTGGANVFADSGYARGDIIQATGRCIEFGGGTELTSPSGSAFGVVATTKKLGTAALPTPLAVTFSNVNELAAYPVGEKFEGVLVALSGTGRTARSGGAVGLNQYLIVDSTLPVASALDSVRVDGQTLANPSITPPALGVIVSNVKGIAYQSARGYYIQLRDGAAITQPSPPSVLNAWATTNTSMRILFDRALDPVTATNAGNYSRSTLKAIDSATLLGPANQAVNLATVLDPQVPAEAEGITAAGVKSSLGVVMNPMAQPETFRAGITPITAIQTNFTVNPPFHPAASDSSQYTFQQVTTRGVITAVDNQTYYIQSGATSNPSSGMIIFAPIDNLNQGDDVTVSGVITEFGSASQATEYSGLDYQNVNGTGVALPAPVVVNPGDVGALTGVEPFPGERYEGMLIRMNGVFVAQDSLPNGQYLVQKASSADTVRVDDNIYHHLFKANSYLNVTGVVNDAFGQYSVLPRSASDIDSLGVVGVEPGNQALAFGLRSISPNPMSFARGASAVVRFNLPSSGKVSARVFDLAGRLVAEPLVNASMAAGPQSFSLDGRSRSGGSLGSGIFFVQLRFENKVATGKFVVTE
jgi:hypothetical protein